jgi:hypothetical protein
VTGAFDIVDLAWSHHESDLAYQIGYGAGHDAGWHAGADWYAQRVEEWLGLPRQVLKSPTHAELEKRRQPSNDPCSIKCGRCSRCIRAAAAARNLAKHGSPDYPGGAA